MDYPVRVATEPDFPRGEGWAVGRDNRLFNFKLNSHLIVTFNMDFFQPFLALTKWLLL